MVESLINHCIHVLKKDHKHLSKGIDFVPCEQVTDILSGIKDPVLLAHIEDESMKNYGHDLRWYTWTIWKMFYDELSHYIDHSIAKKVFFTGEKPCDYIKTQNNIEEEADYRTMCSKITT